MSNFLTTVIPELYRAVERWEFISPGKFADEQTTIIHPVSGNKYHISVVQSVNADYKKLDQSEDDNAKS